MTRDGVVAAAVELADDVGLDGLTMRELASRVGLKPVSLYHHVDDKDDLLDGMIDAVFAEIELPTDTTDWKAALRLKALTARRSLARHRWAIGLLESCRNRPRCRYLRPDRVRGAASGVARP
jgi:AcrR family transcriptional regulator